MPLGRDFLQRIKDRALEQVEQRVRKELAPQIQAPPIGGPPPEQEEEQVQPGLLQRIKEKVRQKVVQLSPVQQRLLNPQAPLDDATIRFRIQYAGQNHFLLLMQYNNQWRLVEPYSYRASGVDHNAPVGAPGPKELRFYGFCRIHDEIHSFDPKKIQGLIVTNQTFSPRWPVEVV